MALDPDVEAWAAAVTRRLHEQGMSQRQLGEAVARIEGRDQNYSQGSIGDWLRVGPPKPQQAFAIEEALGVPPGSQSQYLGYLPLEARPAVTFDEVVERDGRLPEMAQRLLKDLYRSALGD